MIIIIPGEPAAKPRMTRRDKWLKRPATARYWAWVAKAQKIELKDHDPLRIIVSAYFGFPKSYGRKRQEYLKGQFHRKRPDGDNVLKAVVDALWKDKDQRIAVKTIIKRWDDGKGPRVEVQAL